jgi:hypothetical protein
LHQELSMSDDIQTPRHRLIYPPDMEAKHHAITRKLRKRLTDHALGRRPLQPSQVRAIDVLFRTLHGDADPDRPINVVEALWLHKERHRRNGA